MFARTVLLRQARTLTSRPSKNQTRRVLSSSAAAAPKPAADNSGAAMVLAGIALIGTAYVSSNANDQTTRLQTKLQAQVDDLQVQLGGKTNSAFVFLKPHACKGLPGKVEAVLEETLTKNGIRITGQGQMLAEDIDKNMYIDNHYGAIASKAVKLQPSALNVPDKGKADFANAFGETWDSALKAGKIYNAKDAAVKLGLDANGINNKWSSIPKGKLIKFGGGFYCGKIDDIYVMNGFYMSKLFWGSVFLLFVCLLASLLL
jgi:hypothetical protein